MTDSKIENKGSKSTSILTNLSVEQLRSLVVSIGSSDEEVYAYVVRSVRPLDGEYVQTGSGPNFEGGLITLCSCKHSMRAARSSEQWTRGVWVAGLTSWDQDFKKQQSLVYLMRIGEAYDSQAELVQNLRQSGRSRVVDAKASNRHEHGDLMIPASAEVELDNRHRPSAYLAPQIGHVHRNTAQDDGWEYDIDYAGIGGRQSAMLVGDPKFSFMWTEPVIRRRNPGPTRPYRIWTLTSLLNDLEAVP